MTIFIFAVTIPVQYLALQKFYILSEPKPTKQPNYFNFTSDRNVTECVCCLDMDIKYHNVLKCEVQKHPVWSGEVYFCAINLVTAYFCWGKKNWTTTRAHHTFVLALALVLSFMKPRSVCPHQMEENIIIIITTTGHSRNHPVHYESHDDQSQVVFNHLDK